MCFTTNKITVLLRSSKYNRVAQINTSWKLAFQHQNESSDVLLMSCFCWVWMHQVDRGGAEVVIQTAGYEYIQVWICFTFQSMWSSETTAKCWVWWRSALFKNACGCSIHRTSLGWWGWPATSLYLTSWVISSSQRRFRTPLISSIMGIHKDGVSLNTDGRGACFIGERGGCSGVYGKAEGMLLLWLNIYDCSDITCTAVLLYTNCAA